MGNKGKNAIGMDLPCPRVLVKFTTGFESRPRSLMGCENNICIGDFQTTGSSKLDVADPSMSRVDSPGLPHARSIVGL
jgi:hypothetical protein